MSNFLFPFAFNQRASIRSFCRRVNLTNFQSGLASVWRYVCHGNNNGEHINRQQAFFIINSIITRKYAGRITWTLINTFGKQLKYWKLRRICGDWKIYLCRARASAGKQSMPVSNQITLNGQKRGRTRFAWDHNQQSIAQSDDWGWWWWWALSRRPPRGGGGEVSGGLLCYSRDARNTDS